MILNSMLTYNGYTSKINGYSDTEGVDYASLDNSRFAVFNIIQDGKVVPMNPKEIYKGHQPVEIAKDFVGNEMMSSDELFDKAEKLRKAHEDGWIYSFDTETFGTVPEKFEEYLQKTLDTTNVTEGQIDTVRKANSDGHIMTELYMSKQRYKNGKPVKMVDGQWVDGVERVEVLRITNARSVTDMKNLTSVAMSNPAASDLKFSLERAAGFGGEGSYKDGSKYPIYWNPNADIFDNELVNKGIDNMNKHAKYIYDDGTDNFQKGAQETFDVFMEAANDENSIIETLNGDGFDMAVIFDYWKMGEVKDFNEKAQELVLDSHVDAQKLINASGFKKQIYDDINIAYENKMKEAVTFYKAGDNKSGLLKEKEAAQLRLGIRTEDLVIGAAARGADVTPGDYHISREDVGKMQSSLDEYHGPLLDKIAEMKRKSETRVGAVDEVLYTANRAVIFDRDTDVYMSNSFGPDGNTYNNVGMEAGHSYKLNVFNFNDLSQEEIESTGIEDFSNKKILQMEDQYEYADGVSRSSFLVINNDSEIQSRILNTGNIEVRPIAEVSKDSIKISTENALLDRARREKEAWFNMNSDRGFQSFETYLNILQEYRDNTHGGQATTTEKSTIKTILANNDIEEIKKVMPSLFSNRPGSENKIIQERAVNFVNMYDDLDANYAYYQYLKSVVNEKAGDIDTFKYKTKISNNSKARYEHNKVKTAMLYEAKHNLDDALINKLDDNEIIRRFYNENQDAVISAKIQNKAYVDKSSISFTEKIAKARKEKFEDNFGFEYNKKNKQVRETILGYKPIKEDSRSLSQLDVMGNKAEYTRIRTNNIQNLEADLDSLLNVDSIREKSADGKAPARETFLKNLTGDLNKRGIISKEQRKNILYNKNINPYQRATVLAHTIYENRQEVDDIAREINGKENFADNVLGEINYDSLTGKDAEIKKSKLQNYLKNMHNRVIKSPDNGVETYLGENKSVMLNKVTGDAKLSEALAESVTSNLEDVIPGIYTFSADDKSKNDAIKKLMINDFGYTENNADIFVTNIINNKNNQKYSQKGKEVEGGVTNLIKKIDGQGYLITAPRNRQFRIEQMLLEQKRNGTNLDELKRIAMVYKLDEIENKDNIRAIRSSPAAAKAITNSIVAVKERGADHVTFQLQDTMDISTLLLTKQYERGLKEMSLGNFDKANSVVNYAKKEINENKSRSSTVITGRMINGERHFIKEQKLNVSDAMLNNKLDLSDIVYSLDTVLKGNADTNILRKDLERAVGADGVDKLLSKIAKYNDEPWKSNAITFEGLDVGAQLWFINNTKEIADKLLNTKGFMNDNEAIAPVLETMKQYGSALFLSKESGEASKGIVNLNPTHHYAAGAHYSNTARPLVNQTLNSKPMTIEDMFYLANDKNTLNLGLKFDEAKGVISKQSKLEEKLDIKFNRSFIDKDALAIEEMSAAKGEHQAFSARIKYMNAQEFIETINGVNEKDKWVQDLMKKEKIDFGEVKRIVEGIGNVTSIHEDSGAIDPILARVFEQRGVTVKEVEDGAKYKLHQRVGNKEVIGVFGNKVHLQNIDKYYDIKVALGYFEKAELHSFNAKSAKEAELSSFIFKKLFDNASIIMDPNLVKHEAFGSMFTLYSNAIVNNISSEDDAKAVNKIFANRMPEHPHQVKKSGERYVLEEGHRTIDSKFDGLVSYENVVNDIKNLKTDYGTKVKTEINNMERTGVGYADFSLMSDNTIEKPFDFIEDSDKHLKRDGGAKINSRSQQVLGIFVGDDPLSEISKYRTSINGKSTNVLESIIDDDIKQMLRDKTFVSHMKQSANIGSALLLSELHGREQGDIRLKSSNSELGEYKNIAKKARVVDLNLDEAISHINVIGDAREIPAAFSTNYKGNPVNAYKIKLDNMKLINPVYADLVNGDNKDAYAHLFGNNSPELYAKNLGIKKYVDEIYIPAMKANPIGDDKFTLTKVQRAASDLMSTLNDINEGVSGVSLDELHESANRKLANLHESIRFELTDKNGYYKRSLNLRSENSARLKVANVVAPITNSRGQYLNNFYKDRATKIVNGKIQYREVQAINPSDLFGANVKESFTSIGKQILDENVNSSDEFMQFLKKNGGSGNTLEEVKNSLRNNKKTNKEFRELGKKYLEEIGFDSIIMRDPAMLSTSYQTARTYVSDQVVKGSTWIDAVSAKHMNADGDGDEINAFYHMLMGKGNKAKLRTEGDISGIPKALAVDIKNREKINLDIFKKLVSDKSDKTEQALMKSARTISGYNKQIHELRAEDFLEDGGVINTDYIYGKQKVTNALTRILKKSIGQVSNPNYYLKSATSIYSGNRDNTIESLRIQKNIQLLTDTTEQSLIDVKHIRNVDEAYDIAKLAGSYRMNMDKIAVLDSKYSNRRETAMVEMIDQVGSMLHKKGVAIEGDAADLFGDSKIARVNRAEMAGRILSQNKERIKDSSKTTVEGIFMDMVSVLNDDQANKVFFDSTVRQTDMAIKGFERLPIAERSKRALEAIGIGGNKNNRAKIFQETDASNYMQVAPIVNDRILSRGDILYNNDINLNATPGVFEVSSIFTDRDGNATLQLRDLSSKKKRDTFTISGRNFDNVSKNLNGYDVLNSHANKKEVVNNVRNDLLSGYRKKVTSNLENMEQVFNKNKSNSKMDNEVRDIITKDYNKNNLEEFLTDIEIIKNNKWGNEDDITNLRKEMNEAIKEKGSKNYKTARSEAFSKLPGLQKMTVTSGAKFDQWEKQSKAFDNATRESTRKSYFYAKDVEKLKVHSRYNIDEITNHLSKTFDNILGEKEFKNLNSDVMSHIKETGMNAMINNLMVKDNKAKELMQDIFAKNMSNEQFKSQVLHMNLPDALKAGQTQNAYNVLSNTVISYGEHTGFRINQIGLEKASDILSDDYMLGVKYSIDPRIKSETETIIQKMKQMEGKNGIIKINPIDDIPKQLTEEYKGDYVTKIRKEMNDEIRRKGANISEKNINTKSLFNKAKTAFNELSDKKKAVLGGAALGALALTSLALGSSGNKTLSVDKNKYEKEEKSSVKIKEPETKQTRYENVGKNGSVPMSDSRFYTSQNNGLAVNVSGNAPGKSKGPTSMLDFMFGGSNINVTTSFNDERKPATDSEVEDMISNLTIY